MLTSILPSTLSAVHLAVTPDTANEEERDAQLWELCLDSFSQYTAAPSSLALRVCAGGGWEVERGLGCCPSQLLTWQWGLTSQGSVLHLHRGTQPADL